MTSTCPSTNAARSTITTTSPPTPVQQSGLREDLGPTRRGGLTEQPNIRPDQTDQPSPAEPSRGANHDAAPSFLPHLQAPRVRHCSWCAAEIFAELKPGRPRLYCTQTCRQRAYEHRHGFIHRRTPTLPPLPSQRHGSRPVAPATGHELAILRFSAGKLHALRPNVRPDGLRRETLCGLLARPVPARSFGVEDRSCKTCTKAARRKPLDHLVRPANELSYLRSIILEVEEDRLSPATAIEWIRQFPYAA